jgi:hypothetical protein
MGNELRKVSFIIAFIGVCILLVFFTLPSKEFGNLEELRDNEKVTLTGKVVSERDFEDFRIFSLNRYEIDLVCDGCESYFGEDVRVLGVINEYEGKKQVRVLEIIVL